MQKGRAERVGLRWKCARDSLRKGEAPLAKVSKVEEFEKTLRDELHKQVVSRYRKGATVSEIAQQCVSRLEVIVREAKDSHD